jgi:predicted metal-binding membrane protein
MLLMFAVGVGNVGFMLALGAVMAVEKNMSWGRRLSAPLGVALIAGALVVVLFADPGDHALRGFEDAVRTFEVSSRQ